MSDTEKTKKELLLSSLKLQLDIAQVNNAYLTDEVSRLLRECDDNSEVLCKLQARFEEVEKVK